MDVDPEEVKAELRIYLPTVLKECKVPTTTWLEIHGNVFGNTRAFSKVWQEPPWKSPDWKVEDVKRAERAYALGSLIYFAWAGVSAEYVRTMAFGETAEEAPLNSATRAAGFTLQKALSALFPPAPPRRFTISCRRPTGAPSWTWARAWPPRISKSLLRLRLPSMTWRFGKRWASPL